MLLALIVLTSCAVINSVNSAPDEDKFINIEGTPAYVLIEPSKSIELINDDIYICSTEVEGNIRRIKVPMKIVGAVYGTAGLLALIDLATTGGTLAYIFMPSLAVITAASWTTYASAEAISELSAYINLENCLEEKSYTVVFFLKENNE